MSRQETLWIPNPLKKAAAVKQKRSSAHVLLRLMVATLTATGGAGCLDGAMPLPELSIEARTKVPSDVMERVLADLEHEAPRSLVVALGAPSAPPYLVAGDDDASSLDAGTGDARRLMAYAAMKADLERDVGDDFVVEQVFDHLPLLIGSPTTTTALTRLLEDPRVVVVDEIRFYEPSDVESLGLIGQPTAVAGGKTGAGAAVAVLDTGADFTRAAFGSCTAPGVPAATCRVVVAQEFGAVDNARDDPSLHGTNVAAIVAQTAPGAKILALDVFDGPSASSASILAAIDFVVANRAAYNIAALNLSLGYGSFTAPCGADPLAIAVATARTAGVLASVSSGNNGFLNATSSPACAPAAISVGAVYDANVGGIGYGMCTDPVTAADRVACFSNSASFLTVLAPGAVVTAAGVSMTGTSQAAPHVAAAVAVLKAAFPAEGPDALVRPRGRLGRLRRDDQPDLAEHRRRDDVVFGAGDDRRRLRLERREQCGLDDREPVVGQWARDPRRERASKPRRGSQRHLERDGRRRHADPRRHPGRRRLATDGDCDHQQQRRDHPRGDGGPVDHRDRPKRRGLDVRHRGAKLCCL
jgi:subtilisin family serine protease